MRHSSTSPARPTSAEQVRSILAGAHSMTVITDGNRTEVSQVTTSRRTERMHLHPLMPSVPGARITLPEDHRAQATLEFTDIAPVPVRDRVRARVTVDGWLVRDGVTPDNRCMEFERALLRTADGETEVGLDALLAARTDPLASCEATMLTHLADHHSELMPLLMRLVEPRFGQAVVRALPLALDRYGLTLRLEYARGHRDVRLSFSSAVDDVDQAGVQVRTLLAAAHRVPRRNRLLSDS